MCHTSIGAQLTYIWHHYGGETKTKAIVLLIVPHYEWTSCNMEVKLKPKHVKQHNSHVKPKHVKQHNSHVRDRQSPKSK